MALLEVGDADRTLSLDRGGFQGGRMQLRDYP